MSRKLSRWMRPLAAAVVPALLGILGCGKDPLVGGTCRVGLTECSLQCTDTNEDLSNCGSCGHVCGNNLICFGGICADEGLLGLRDARGDAPADGGSSDVLVDVSALQDGGESPDGGGPEASDGSSLDGEAGEPGCLPPFNTVEHCGDCATSCASPTPVCGLAGTYKCLGACEAPLEPCGAECVDKFSDERNCGACGNLCASGICQAGECVGRGFGHEIVIGMDYDVAETSFTQSSAQVVLLSASVFLSDRAEVRVLAYDEYADAATVARINGWLTTAAPSKGRSVTFTSVGEFTSLPAKLAVTSFDVLLVYDQPLAPLGHMATAGTLWNGPIDAFAKGGGLVVALDGHSPGHVAEFLTNSGLLSVAGETDIAVGKVLRVDAPTDVVGVSLPDVFSAKRNTVSFTTNQAPDNHHVFVVKDESGLPVVVHSVP